jgi:hypothetical protein
VIGKRHEPPEGNDAGREVAPLVQVIVPIVKAEPAEVAAEESVRDCSPMFKTVRNWVTDCPGATVPKPRLPVE